MNSITTTVEQGNGRLAYLRRQWKQVNLDPRLNEQRRALALAKLCRQAAWIKARINKVTVQQGNSEPVDHCCMGCGMVYLTAECPVC